MALIIFNLLSQYMYNIYLFIYNYLCWGTPIQETYCRSCQEFDDYNLFIKFWSYNARSDWLCSRYAWGYVNTVMTYHCILLALFYKRNRKWPLLVDIAWCKHSRKFGRIRKYSLACSSCLHQLSNSSKLSLVFASGYVNTRAIFYF